MICNYRIKASRYSNVIALKIGLSLETDLKTTIGRSCLGLALLLDVADSGFYFKNSQYHNWRDITVLNHF